MLYVDSGVTLTITPGVVVQTTSLHNDITVDGTLDATGVNFTGSQTDIQVE